MNYSDPQLDSASTHPELEQLQDFLSGKIALQTDWQRIESHLESCKQCQDICLRLPQCELENRLSEVATKSNMAPTKMGCAYQLGEEIGRGGSGVVYQALQPGMGRPVAIKMLVAGAKAHPRELSRFRREAYTLAQLHHASIVAVFDSGEQNGIPYLAMELIDGSSLAKVLQTGPLDVIVAAEVVRLLADAVQYAHNANVLHRDIKPQNVLLGKRDQSTKSTTTVIPWEPKLIDFGLARLDEPHGFTKTKTGELMGTPEYMAPEMFQADRIKDGPSIDIYGLGAVLYECLTGRPPFQGSTFAEVSNQIVNDTPASIRLLRPNVPRDLETICLRALAKTPKQRFATAGDFAEDLGHFLNHEPIRSLRPRWYKIGISWCRRNPWRAIALSAFLIGSITVPIATSYHVRRLQIQANIAATNYQKTRASLWKVLDQLQQASSSNMTKLTELSLSQSEEALTLFRHLAKADPSPQSKFDLIKSEILVGSHSVMLNKLDEGRQHFESAISIGGVLVGEYAGRDEVNEQIAIAKTKLAKTYTSKDFDRASKLQSDALELFRGLVDEHADNMEYLSSLAWALHSMGALHHASKRLDDAKGYYDQSIDIRTQLCNRGYLKESSIQAMSGSLANRALLYSIQGNLEEAERDYRDAFDRLERIRESQTRAASEPSFLVDWTGSILNMATLLGNSNRVDESISVCTLAVDVAGPAFDREPNIAKLRDHLFKIVATRAQLFESQEQFRDAAKDWLLVQKFATDTRWKRISPIYHAVSLSRTTEYRTAIDQANTIVTDSGKWNELIPGERWHLVRTWTYAAQSANSITTSTDDIATINDIQAYCQRAIELALLVLAEYGMAPRDEMDNRRKELDSPDWQFVKDQVDSQSWKLIESRLKTLTQGSD